MSTQSDSDEKFAERLAASKEEFEQRQNAEGRARGEKWAQVQASFESLRLLAFLHEDELLADLDAVMAALEGRDKTCMSAQNLEDYFGSRHPSPDYVKGFVEGALEAALDAGIWIE